MLAFRHPLQLTKSLKKKTRLAFSFNYFLPPLTGALSAFSIASLIVLV